MIQSAVFAWIGIFLAGIPNSQASLSGQKLGTAAAPVIELQLDFTPMTSSVSSYFSLQTGGHAELFRYSPNRLAVYAHRAGEIPRQQASAFLARTQTSEAAKAFEKANFSGVGLTRGDQIRLRVRNEDGSTRFLYGFVDDTPQEIRDLTRDLLAWGERLERSLPLAAAYLRSKEVPSNLVTSLRSSRRVRVAHLDDLPPQSRSVAENSIVRPDEFTGRR